MTESNEFLIRKGEFDSLFAVIKKRVGIDKLHGEELIKAKHKLWDDIFKHVADTNDLSISMLEGYIKSRWSENVLEEMKIEAGFK